MAEAPSFQTKLYIDMMTNISFQLPSIDINSIRYHMMRPEYKQIIISGEVTELPPCSETDLYPVGSVAWEVKTMNLSKFLAGCLFKVHDEGFIELIYFVVNHNY